MSLYKRLAELPPGDYEVRPNHAWWQFWRNPERRGWVNVAKDSSGNSDIMLTSDRAFHRPFDGPARSFTVTPTGNLVCYMESVLRFHFRWGFGKGGDIELHSANEYARWLHEKLCCDGVPTSTLA